MSAIRNEKSLHKKETYNSCNTIGVVVKLLGKTCPPLFFHCDDLFVCFCHCKIMLQLVLFFPAIHFVFFVFIFWFLIAYLPFFLVLPFLEFVARFLVAFARVLKLSLFLEIILANYSRKLQMFKTSIYVLYILQLILYKIMRKTNFSAVDKQRKIKMQFQWQQIRLPDCTRLVGLCLVSTQFKFYWRGQGVIKRFRKYLRNLCFIIRKKCLYIKAKKC